MSNSAVIRLAGLVGIIAALFGLIAVLAATVLAGENFSWSKNALSDLGVSQVANVFNYSLITVGILSLIFAFGFMKAYAKNAFFYVGGILLMLGSVSLSLIGVFTEHYGVLHVYVSVGYFALFPVAMILVGTAFARMNMRSKGYVSILAGVIEIIVILGGEVFAWHKWLGLGFAVPEYIASVIFASWTTLMGASLVQATKT